MGDIRPQGGAGRRFANNESLRPFLAECFERAKECAVYVINQYRDTNSNLLPNRLEFRL